MVLHLACQKLSRGGHIIEFWSQLENPCCILLNQNVLYGFCLPWEKQLTKVTTSLGNKACAIPHCIPNHVVYIGSETINSCKSRTPGRHINKTTTYLHFVTRRWQDRYPHFIAHNKLWQSALHVIWLLQTKWLFAKWKFLDSHPWSWQKILT